MDATLDTAPCGFLSFTDDGLIREVNRTLCDLIQSTPDLLVGAHLESILSTPSRIFYQTHLLPLIKMGGVAEEIYLSLRSSQGNQLPVLVNALRRELAGDFRNDCVLLPVRRRDQYENELLASKRAIEDAHTQLQSIQRLLEVKQAELTKRNSELEALKDHLEERVGERTLELVAANAELQKMAYSMAHTLRAPMRAILSGSRILQEELGDSLGPDHRFLLDRQALNATTLSGMLDDLLQYSRVGQKRLTLMPLDVARIADQSVGYLRLRYPELNVRFEVEENLHVVADPQLARLLVDHLLDNAVKFSPPDGRIVIGSAVRAGDRYVLVSDEGPGIEPKYFERVFLPFERLHLEDVPGNGMGLALAARVAERHKGSILLENEPGQGLTVLFRLAESSASEDEPTRRTAAVATLDEDASMVQDLAL